MAAEQFVNDKDLKGGINYIRIPRAHLLKPQIQGIERKIMRAENADFAL